MHNTNVVKYKKINLGNYDIYDDAKKRYHVIGEYKGVI